MSEEDILSSLNNQIDVVNQILVSVEAKKRELCETRLTLMKPTIEKIITIIDDMLNESKDCFHHHFYYVWDSDKPKDRYLICVKSDCRGLKPEELKLLKFLNVEVESDFYEIRNF